jgi:hypothetical protein
MVSGADGADLVGDVNPRYGAYSGVMIDTSPCLSHVPSLVATAFIARFANEDGLKGDINPG